ncbi:MAG TPA: hypothetical protein VLA39_08945 [Marinobacterium sp.]|nr:hypothetical protein [Marinobacterium sp.]
MQGRTYAAKHKDVREQRPRLEMSLFREIREQRPRLELSLLREIRKRAADPSLAFSDRFETSAMLGLSA